MRHLEERIRKRRQYAYPDELGLREARQRFFVDSGLGAEADYSARWVKLELKPFPFYFPNTRGRVRAVKLHDIHHVVTGYDTSLRGEAEIAAWELASGCAHHAAAWFLNYGAFVVGLFASPARLFRAFVRGRHSVNLYRGEFDEALLDETVGSLRRRLGLDRTAEPATFADRTHFALWVVLSAAGMAGAAAAAVLLLKGVTRVLPAHDA